MVQDEEHVDCRDTDGCHGDQVECPRHIQVVPQERQPPVHLIVNDQELTKQHVEALLEMKAASD